MNDYTLARYHRIRAYYIEQLGGCCVQCSSVEELQFDHVDPTTKLYTIGQIMTHGKEKLETEIAKCQLLCRSCHEIKTSEQFSVQHGAGLTGKRDCKCDLCVPLRRARAKVWNKKARQKRKNKALMV